MQKKLTSIVDEQVYNGLRRNAGPGNIRRIVEDCRRPQVINTNLEEGFAAMAKDRKRVKEAWKWAETTFKGIYR